MNWISLPICVISFRFDLRINNTVRSEARTIPFALQRHLVQFSQMILQLNLKMGATSFFSRLFILLWRSRCLDECIVASLTWNLHLCFRHCPSSKMHRHFWPSTQLVCIAGLEHSEFSRAIFDTNGVNGRSLSNWWCAAAKFQLNDNLRIEQHMWVMPYEFHVEANHCQMMLFQLSCMRWWMFDLRHDRLSINLPLHVDPHQFPLDRLLIREWKSK